MLKRRGLNRVSVIEKAVEMANQAGSVAAVSLASLAEALEIRPPSLYNHIAGLEDLHEGMAVFGLGLLLADLRQAAQGLLGLDALLAMAISYRQFVHTHPGIYPLIVRAPGSDAPERAALSEELVQMLMLIMASIGLQGDDAVHAIRGLRAILHGFASLEANDGFKIPLDREESFRRLVSTYLNGLRP